MLLRAHITSPPVHCTTIPGGVQVTRASNLDPEFLRANGECAHAGISVQCELPNLLMLTAARCVCEWVGETLALNGVGSRGFEARPG